MRAIDLSFFKSILLDIKALSEVFRLLCLKRTVYFYTTGYRLWQLKGNCPVWVSLCPSTLLCGAHHLFRFPGSSVLLDVPHPVRSNLSFSKAHQKSLSCILQSLFMMQSPGMFFLRHTRSPQISTQSSDYLERRQVRNLRSTTYQCSMACDTTMVRPQTITDWMLLN